MRAIFLLSALFISFLAQAQKETRNWFMHSNRAAITSAGVSAGLPFPPHGFNPTNASTSVSDSLGNLLFACDGNTIIDKNLTPMPTLELANVSFNAMEGVVMAQRIPNTS